MEQSSSPQGRRSRVEAPPAFQEVCGVLEDELRTQGFDLLGTDEVGRGCLAGPVYAACVVMDYRLLRELPADEIKLVRDSKTLSAQQRHQISTILRRKKIVKHEAIGIAEVKEIEEIGIVRATGVAMDRAVQKLLPHLKNPLALVDGNIKLISANLCPQRTVVKGDRLCFAIAAASIIAKIARDEFMKTQSTLFPGYGFEENVGYGTARHLDALQKLGITALHRRNFAPCASEPTN